MIDNATKEQIKGQLINYCSNCGSDNKASKSLGISNAYISNIRNSKWDMISDDMWRKISKMLNMNLADEWVHVDTLPFRAVTELFDDAQRYANVYGVTCDPGTVKTHALDNFRRVTRNVYYVKCQRHTTDRAFLQQLLTTMGRKNTQSSTAALLWQLGKEVERLDSPLFIIDELEKVSSDVKLLFIDIYNLTEGKAGIVLLGTPNLARIVERNVFLGKVGFNEFLSRIGGRFVQIPSNSKKDAIAMIQANGITDPVEINSIINDSETDNGGYDGRRIKRLVHKVKLGRNQAA